jgi:glycosyltransferase involved in cell wall biosynthesis
LRIELDKQDLDMKILFITHDASRTGAPRVILHLLAWLSKNTQFQYETLCLKIGEVLPEFENFGKIHILPVRGVFARILRKISRNRLCRDAPDLIISKKLAEKNYEIIYANTVVSLPIAATIAKLQKKRPILIAHIHEGYIMTANLLPNIQSYCVIVDRFIAGSHLVKKDLIRLGVKENLIVVIYEFSNSNINSFITAKIKSSKFYVGGAGYVNWRKGVDFFVLVADYCRKNFPNLEIEFVWIGSISKLERLIIDEDMRKASIENITFVGEVKNLSDHFNELDLFLMTSREDPFPLVCIDVAQRGVPIVCFAGATGTEEILIRGGGKIVPYMDIQAMAEVINTYYHNRAMLISDGEKVKNLFSEFVPDKICPEILELIQELLRCRKEA